MSASSKPDASQFDGSKSSAAMDKYSRQVGAYGVGVMKFLRELKVLIVGLKGVGIETAKDLVLTGPLAVHIADNGLAEPADLGVNFFLTQSSLGTSRAAACASALQELNDDVEVLAVHDEITTDVLKNYGAVIVTDNTIPLEKLEAWDHFAVENKIVFVLAFTAGPFAFVFSDFGSTHQVDDADGEPHKFLAIKHIALGADGKLEIETDEPYELEDGRKVQFEDIKSVPQLDMKTFSISRLYNKFGTRSVLIPDKFAIDTGDADLSTWGKYENGGYIREVKETVSISHKRLSEALLSSDVSHPDQMRAMLSSAGQQGIIAQRALWAFIARHGNLPRLHNQEDAAEYASLAKEINADAASKEATSLGDFDPEPFVKLALYARTELSGFAAFIGGVVAQEIIKKCGKWLPISQFLVHDELGLVSNTVPEDATPKGTRYDHLVSLFGQAFQNSLQNDKWFLVGCGALGCEYMKAFALMGVGTGPDGLLFATDMDTIEVSNLARQFLFRRQHVHKPKSVCAASAARIMNPDMKIKVYEDKVAPDTESLFDAEFWTQLTGVCNALDNVAARLYVDSQCVFYKRPLLESGTLGTKANVEVIIPHKTGSYAQGHVEVKEKQVPQCTMKNFPYMIEHTIGWAGKAGEFNNLFVTPASDLKAAVDDLSSLWKGLERLQNVAEKIERLENLTALLDAAKSIDFSNPSKPENFAVCVHLAFDRFIAQYRTQILDLIHNFPEDATTTTKDGKVLPEPIPFWSAPKRFPKVAQWDAQHPDPAHLEYIYNAANLYAHLFHLNPVRDEDVERSHFRQLLINLNLAAPEWKPSNKKIDLGETEAPAAGAAPESSHDGASTSTAGSADEDQAKLDEIREKVSNFDYTPLRNLQNQLKQEDPKASAIQPAEFEKDDDTNFHIDFVTAASNLRAFNYSIPSADRHRTKMIAGNIIPAIATTTAMITGLNSIEFLKLKMELPVDKFYNANINLGTATFSLFEPEGPAKASSEYDPIENCEVVPVPAGFTVWDQIVVKPTGDKTLRTLLSSFPSLHHGVEITSIIGHNAKPLPGMDGQIFTDIVVNADQKAKIARYQDLTLPEIWTAEYGSLPKSSFLVFRISAILDDVPVKIPNPVIYQLD